MPKDTTLTHKQIAFIKSNRFKMCGADLARALKVNNCIVTKYMRKHKLALPRATIYQMTGAKRKGTSIVSAYGDFFLMACYLYFPIKSMAHFLGYNESVIFTRMRQLGLVVPPEIVEQRKQMARFKPGQEPPNKGKKQADYMSKESIKRTLATRFKKGQLPHNTKYDGATYIRRDKSGRLYTWVRLAKKQWKMLHVKIWEDKYGPVPEGKIVVFKDKNSQNITLRNLELITRKENMARNTIHRYPVELKQLIRLNHKVKRRTNELRKSKTTA